ncbi:MAG: acyloxyacyl hydrolase [Phycisphaerales bacterium]|nr:hypothetical protein [Planctomycetaceae bacterium]MDP6311454.1 acyloxyacyl hydrolase [Phycisphaerales bacterium]MDP7087283.1 acyloxyacyl hydrolase [Phycisphaerales bacterium]MDP7188939.1 acyloxyacyl hydrolase [Phycisphaerales bacterium]MDP7519224.1 acyloxyacyl hydrolase [Phycisphaerales bacterium]
MMLTTILASSLCSTSPASALLPPPPPVPSIRAALGGQAPEVGPLEIDLGSGDRRAGHLTPWADTPPLDFSSRSMWQQDEAAAPAEATTAFGAEGSTRWSITGRWGVDANDTGNNEYGLGLGLQLFLVDDFAFAPEINLWGFSQEGENAFGGSLDFMFQWHFVKGETWSLYGDFGCGMLGTNHNVPSGGSQFNFTPQAGFGVTFDVGQDRRWIIGVRWHHISNATLYQNNPGRDSVMVYTGLSLPF